MIEITYSEKVEFEIKDSWTPDETLMRYRHSLSRALMEHWGAYGKHADVVVVSAWCPKTLVWPGWLSVLRELLTEQHEPAKLVVAVDDWESWFTVSHSDPVPEPPPGQGDWYMNVGRVAISRKRSG